MKKILKWGAIGFGGFIVLLVIIAIFAPEPEGASDAPANSSANALPDYIEFGSGEDPASDSLGLVGVSKTFNQNADIWMRVKLRKPAGKARWEYFLQQRQDSGGWSTKTMWSSTGDPDSNIFLERESALQRLDPGNYEVFVLIGDEKRAAGSFTIVSPPTSGNPTPTLPVAVEATIVAAIEVTPQAVPTATSTPQPTPSGPRTEFGDGKWRVGVDIAPGTYHIEASDRCYWARLSGFGGGDIIANENSLGPWVVAIQPSDAGFESKRCGTWVQAETVVPPQPATQMGDGVWRIGIDITPGLYFVEASDRCYWARLSGFGGGDVIANENTVGSSIVDIKSTDAGFESKRCGTWKLQETP